MIRKIFYHTHLNVIKSPQSGVTLCFQLFFAAASAAAAAAAMTLAFHVKSNDLDLVVSRSKSEIALFQEGRGLIAMEGTKEMWVDHSWPWLWPIGNHGGVGECTV